MNVEENIHLNIMGSLCDVDENDANVDVEVIIDGQKYVATFFTPDNIKTILNQYQANGECKGGLYLWASDMVIVRELNEDSIRESVLSLIADGEFESAFSGPFDVLL